MKKLLLAILLLVLPITAYAADLPKPKLFAVYFWADTCPNCKILGPKIDEARAKGDLDNKDVLFVIMNFSNKASIHQSLLNAKALGIDDYVKKQGSGTGYLALLEPKDKKAEKTFFRDATAEDILETIKDKLD